jgi:hypothetical protein
MDRSQINLRLPDDLVAAIDTRIEQVKAAGGRVRSRNEWITDALAFMIEHLPYDPDGEEGSRAQAAQLVDGFEGS